MQRRVIASSQLAGSLLQTTQHVQNPGRPGSNLPRRKAAVETRPRRTRPRCRTVGGVEAGQNPVQVIFGLVRGQVNAGPILLGERVQRGGNFGQIQFGPAAFGATRIDRCGRWPCLFAFRRGRLQGRQHLVELLVQRRGTARHCLPQRLIQMRPHGVGKIHILDHAPEGAADRFRSEGVGLPVDGRADQPAVALLECIQLCGDVRLDQLDRRRHVQPVFEFSFVDEGQLVLLGRVGGGFDCRPDILDTVAYG